MPNPQNLKSEFGHQKRVSCARSALRSVSVAHFQRCNLLCDAVVRIVLQCLCSELIPSVHILISSIGPHLVLIRRMSVKLVPLNNACPNPNPGVGVGTLNVIFPCKNEIKLVACFLVRLFCLLCVI